MTKFALLWTIPNIWKILECMVLYHKGIPLRLFNSYCNAVQLHKGQLFDWTIRYNLQQVLHVSSTKLLDYWFTLRQNFFADLLFSSFCMVMSKPHLSIDVCITCTVWIGNIERLSNDQSKPYEFRMLKNRMMDVYNQSRNLFSILLIKKHGDEPEQNQILSETLARSQYLLISIFP